MHKTSKTAREPQSPCPAMPPRSPLEHVAAVLLPFLESSIPSGNDSSLADLLHRPLPDAPRKFAIPEGSNDFAISAACARFLVSVVIERECRNILEFGAGTSSLVFARALAYRGGGSLTSVEQAPQWCEATWAQVCSQPGVDAVLIAAQPHFQIDRRGAFYSYESTASELQRRAPYDLILIDAPQGYFGRDGAFHAAMQVAAPDAIIILDDASRWKERWSMHRWLAAYDHAKLATYSPDFGNCGIAVLELEGSAKPRASLIVIAASACHALINWVWRLRHRRALHQTGTA